MTEPLAALLVPLGGREAIAHERACELWEDAGLIYPGGNLAFIIIPQAAQRLV